MRCLITNNSGAYVKQVKQLIYKRYRKFNKLRKEADFMANYSDANKKERQRHLIQYDKYIRVMKELLYIYKHL